VRRVTSISTRFALGLLLATACGVPSPSNTTTTTGETAAEEAGLDVGSGDGGGTDPMQCEAEVAALAPFVTRPDGGCSVVVRVHHETLALLGYQPTCSALRDEPLEESEARELTDCCASTGTALDSPADQGLWVFHAASGDAGEPGHVAIVSSNVGARIFEATIARGDGNGEIVFPEAWVEPDGLGESCGAVPMPELVSWDLVEGSRVADDRLREVWRVVGTTALPFAMGVVGEPRRAAVLRYARRVDSFEPSTAEYLVVIEGGIDDPARMPDD
jgi:subtilisin family serine protease